MQIVLILMNLFITTVFILKDQFITIKNIRSGFWRDFTIPFTAVFLIEAIMVIVKSSGATILREKKLYILEVICQVCSMVALVKMYTAGESNQ